MWHVLFYFLIVTSIDPNCPIGQSNLLQLQICPYSSSLLRVFHLHLFDSLKRWFRWSWWWWFRWHHVIVWDWVSRIVISRGWKTQLDLQALCINNSGLNVENPDICLFICTLLCVNNNPALCFLHSTFMQQKTCLLPSKHQKALWALLKLFLNTFIKLFSLMWKPIE